MAQNIPNNDSGKPNQQNIRCSSEEIVQEYVVRLPKVKSKLFSVMRFNSSSNIDVSKWSCPEMERENNLKEFQVDEELPKYGAGSEFGRDRRKESRRKKYGAISRKYNPDEQPWILKTGGKTGKKFKGIREGGVTENASYYVFTQAPDGAFEAFPIEEWYNFSPIHCYKTLSAEEAEEEFERRDKVMNYFDIMLKKRLKAEEQVDDEEEAEKRKGKRKKALVRKEFKISDADDSMNLSDDSEGDSGDETETVSSKKKKESGKNVKKKGKKRSSDVEALEESDEGDFDNREVDYITDSSSSEEEPEDENVNRELKGVEDEEAFRKFDASGEEEEEEKETEESQEMKEKALESKPKSKAKKTDNPSGDSSSDTSDSDFDDSKVHSAMFMQKAKKTNGSDIASRSRANTPTRTNSDPSKEVRRGVQKRKLTDPSTPAVKRSKADPSSPASQSLSSTSSSDAITEDAIRRYLSRKPMTASEILQKFKSKKTGMNSEQLVSKIAALLKKVNPIKHHVKNKTYFSLKS